MRRATFTISRVLRLTLSVLLSLLLVVDGAFAQTSVTAGHRVVVAPRDESAAESKQKANKTSSEGSKDDAEAKNEPQADPAAQTDPAAQPESALDSEAQGTEGAAEPNGDSYAESTVTQASGSLTLSQKFVSADGHTYLVRVECDEGSGVPANAELVVADVDESGLEALRAQTEQELALQSGDRVFWDAYLHVSLEANGRAVTPAGEVYITVQTNALAPSEAASAEVVLLREEEQEQGEYEGQSEFQDEEASDDFPAEGAEDEAQEREAVEGAASAYEGGAYEAGAYDESVAESDAWEESANAEAGSVEPTPLEAIPDPATDPLPHTHIVPTTLVSEGNKTSRLGFSATHLGTLALASVMTKLTTWHEQGLDAWVWGPRHGLRASIMQTDAPKLKTGIDALSCYDVSMEPCPEQGVTLWFEAQRASAADEPLPLEQDGLGGAFAYAAREGRVARELCGPEGTTDPVELRANDDQLLFAWDTGYRKATLAMDEVTVRGMVPEGTTGQASDVMGTFDAPVDLLDDKNVQDAIEDGTMELKTLAAYNITLATEEGEYQPDDEHPLKVTISNEAIREDKELLVWHVADDGSVQQVEGVTIKDGSLSFTATGFSTYAVSELIVDPATAARSTNFLIRCSALGYARSSRVTFVDTDQNPLVGMYSGTIPLSYTGEGDGSNPTNTIDMYDFQDFLDPSIADEYEFSRVYVLLDKTYGEQKDFRYMQVADDKIVGESRNPPYYRSYLYMQSIDQCRSGQEYHGTWYLLSNGGAIDPIFIEYYHVATAEFHAIDSRGDPVEGAEFALYTDSTCYMPLEYKDKAVVARSGSDGLVSFGKIPRGTYYMKETAIPSGYKKSTRVHTVVVDGQTAIDDVVHEDDDGSVIVNDAKELTIHKEWDEADPSAYDDYSVEVTVSSNGELVDSVTLSKHNEWTQTLTGLDPNVSYEVTEKSVRNARGVDVTNDWLPTIESTIDDEAVEYQKADEFIKGEEFVLVANGKALTAAASGTGLTPQAVTVRNNQLVSEVSSNMLWRVVSLTNDGVISLQNDGTHKYLDQHSSSSLKWYQNQNPPQFVRHLNDDGTINIYYRENLNNTSTIWLYMVNRVDRSGRYSDAANFSIFRKVDVKTYNVTITNKSTTYPFMVRNVNYPQNTALPHMEYAVYTEESYKSSSPAPLKSSLVANEDGYLEEDGSSILELNANTYYLVRTASDGYAPQNPVRFTITRNGMVRVRNADKAIAGFAYNSSKEVGNATYPLLQLPNYRPAALEVSFRLEGDFADLSRSFGFTLELPDGLASVEGTVGGRQTTFVAGQPNEFELKHGQSLVLWDLPASQSYVLAQTSPVVAAQPQERDGMYHTSASAMSGPAAQGSVTVTPAQDDVRRITLSDLVGTADAPAQVAIVDALANNEAPPTGVNDNTLVWGVTSLACACALAALWLQGRRADWGSARTRGRN